MPKPHATCCVKSVARQGCAALTAPCIMPVCPHYQAFTLSQVGLVASPDRQSGRRKRYRKRKMQQGRPADRDKAGLREGRCQESDVRACSVVEQRPDKHALMCGTGVGRACGSRGGQAARGGAGGRGGGSQGSEGGQEAAVAGRYGGSTVCGAAVAAATLPLAFACGRGLPRRRWALTARSIMCTYTSSCSVHIEADALCKLPTQCSTEHFLAQVLLDITHDIAGGF